MIQFFIYLVEDKSGNKSAAVCEQTSDVIQLCGLSDYFETDAHKLESWCKKKGFRYKCIKKEYTFNELWF